MKSIIIGGGKIGYYLLKTLKENNYDVVLIERESSICNLIAGEIDANVIYGDGTDIDVLKDAGIEEAEIIAAVTGTDEENLVICQIAKVNFNISTTITRVNNPKNVATFRALGVDNIVCSTEVIANLIEYEIDKKDFKIIQTLERGSMMLIELRIKEGSIWSNISIKDLELPEECIITSILRDDKIVYPKGDLRILENDNILILTNNSGLANLKKHYHNGG